MISYRNTIACPHPRFHIYKNSFISCSHYTLHQVALDRPPRSTFAARTSILKLLDPDSFVHGKYFTAARRREAQCRALVYGIVELATDLADARRFQLEQSRRQQSRRVNFLLERSSPLVFTTTLLEKKLQPRFRGVGHRASHWSPTLPPCAFGADGTVMFASATVLGEVNEENKLRIENEATSSRKNTKATKDSDATKAATTPPNIVMVTPTSGHWRELVDIFDTYDSGGRGTSSEDSAGGLEGKVEVRVLIKAFMQWQPVDLLAQRLRSSVLVTLQNMDSKDKPRATNDVKKDVDNALVLSSGPKPPSDSHIQLTRVRYVAIAWAAACDLRRQLASSLAPSLHQRSHPLVAAVDDMCSKSNDEDRILQAALLHDAHTNTEVTSGIATSCLLFEMWRCAALEALQLLHRPLPAGSATSTTAAISNAAISVARWQQALVPLLLRLMEEMDGQTSARLRASVSHSTVLEPLKSFHGLVNFRERNIRLASANDLSTRGAGEVCSMFSRVLFDRS